MFQPDLFKFESNGLWSFETDLFARGYTLIAGIDEAGRGPLAGPVVAAAAAAVKRVDIEGVNDSKQLTPDQRDVLYHKILGEPGLIIGVGIASVEEIDEINILQASILAFSRAVSKLPEKPDFCLIDGNKKCHLMDIPQMAVVKGDSRSFLVAAASIIAKVTRDRMMAEYHEKWPQYGFNKHKGYAVKSHLGAIKKYGICEIHRRTFSPVREAVNKFQG